MPELVEIRIVGLPVDVYLRASEHGDELMREFALISTGEAGTGSDISVPARLLAVVDELRTRFAGFTNQPEAELSAAAARGDSTLDLVYRVPPDAATAAGDLGDLLDEADTYCQSGDLLTLTTPPEALAFRRWFLGEFARQVDGEPPLPWLG